MLGQGTHHPYKEDGEGPEKNKRRGRADTEKEMLREGRGGRRRENSTRWRVVKENPEVIASLIPIFGVFGVGLWAVKNGNMELNLRMQKARVGFQVLAIILILRSAYKYEKRKFLELAKNRP